MTDLVKRLEDAIEHHRTMCCALTVRAMDRETKGEGVREGLAKADAKLLDTIMAALSHGEMVMVPRTADYALIERRFDTREWEGADYRDAQENYAKWIKAASPSLENGQ